MKTLEVGKDYSGIFGIPSNCKMIYNGGISWTGVKPDGSEKMMESEKQTKAAIEYINRDSCTIQA